MLSPEVQPEPKSVLEQLLGHLPRLSGLWNPFVWENSIVCTVRIVCTRGNNDHDDAPGVCIVWCVCVCV